MRFSQQWIQVAVFCVCDAV